MALFGIPDTLQSQMYVKFQLHIPINFRVTYSTTKQQQQKDRFIWKV